MGKSKSSRNIKKITLQERHVDWMLACPDPTPLAFFQFIFPSHRVNASKKYKKALDLAFKEAVDEDFRNKIEEMKKSANEARILEDWETWMQQKTAILVRRGVRNTNLSLHEEINTLSLNKEGSSAKNMKSDSDSDTSEHLEEEDQEEEESADEIDKFFMNKGNNEKIRNDITSNDIGNINFVERIEESKLMSSTCQRPWVLRSGTNVGDKLASYVKTIPETQKCLNLAYWNILDLTENTQIKSLFSTNDWEEMVESFNNEVKLIESDFLDVVEYFFDEVEKITKKDDKDIINAIDGLTPEIIETNRKVELSDEEKNVISILRRAVVTYAENLERVDLPVSEADFDNAFPNMLAKRFLNREELKMDVGEIACWASAYRRNEGRSVVFRARIGQKCDFRGTLKKSINKFEALIGLRSGGLPEPHKKKIYEDKVDLSVAMRDILYTFFRENSKAPSSDIHSTFVLGIHSWGWIHDIYGMDCKATNILRLGCISHSKMPNTLKTLSVLESFYVLFTDLQTTLNTICEHTNSVSLAHSRAHRNRKRKNPEQAGEKGGSFGNPSQSPAKKDRKYEDH
ncbi:2188_t:CDS:10 [Acaulospora morrowiae]|uniref:2188_t:CDS:1 n=1 Tax=Acaulospora morrowiae TaxID=94023 RepID=A0A9N9BBC6_9GLOM|nr:2188_t:CDS:10 [Acaulospora morrowiae]